MDVCNYICRVIICSLKLYFILNIPLEFLEFQPIFFSPSLFHFFELFLFYFFFFPNRTHKVKIKYYTFEGICVSIKKLNVCQIK